MPEKNIPNIFLHRLFSSQKNQIILIICSICFCYFHTFDVPFYYDDYLSILGNVAIQEFNLHNLWEQYSARFIGYITFALNYRVHGFNIFGYHLLNIAIHIANSILVFFICKLLLSTPLIAKNTPSNLKKWFPLFCALLFALHPLQIQAITYITQRLASLSAFFYLVSIYCFLKARSGNSNKIQLIFAICTISAFLLAFFTKQNALTAPLIWLIIDIVCFPQNINRHIGIFTFGIFSCVLAYICIPLISDQTLFQFIDQKTRETTLFSRKEYFLVQMHVILDYIIKFFAPYELTLNYEFDTPQSFLQLSTLSKTFIHFSLLSFGILFVRKLPLVSLGIFFYYASHLIESSVIPIRDFGFDHRTYLPNFGLCIATSWIMAKLLAIHPTRNLATAIIFLFTILAILTWQRNNTWRDPIAFFTSETKVLPDSFRAHCFLGQSYFESGRTSEALSTYEKAWQMRSNDVQRGNNTMQSCATNFASTLQQEGDLRRALTLINSLNLNDFTAENRSKIYNTLGNIYALRNSFSRAQEYYERGLELVPSSTEVLSNLAKLKILTGELQTSLNLFQQLKEVDPDNEDARIGLEYLQNLLSNP